MLPGMLYKSGGDDDPRNDCMTVADGGPIVGSIVSENQGSVVPNCSGGGRSMREGFKFDGPGPDVSAVGKDDCSRDGRPSAPGATAESRPLTGVRH